MVVLLTYLGVVGVAVGVWYCVCPAEVPPPLSGEDSEALLKVVQQQRQRWERQAERWSRLEDGNAGDTETSEEGAAPRDPTFQEHYFG